MKNLYRSRENKMFTGLCGGLGEITNVDATLYRVLLVVLTILTSGIFIVLYLIVSAVVPKSPNIHAPFGHQQRPYGTPPYGQGGQPYGSNPYGGNHQGYQDPNQPRATSSSQWNQNYNQYQTPPNQSNYQPSSATDQMMDDLEKKALRREIEELKSKISKMEKGE